MAFNSLRDADRPLEDSKAICDRPEHPGVFVGVVLLSMVAFTASAFMGLHSGELPKSWAIPAATMVWLSVVWHYKLPPPTHWLAASLVLLPATAVLTALAISDLPAATTTKVTLWACFQGLVMAAAYRLVMHDGRWAPRNPTDLTRLVAAILMAAVVTSAWGFRPGGHPFQPQLLDLWWGVRTAVYAVIGSVCFYTLFFFPRRKWRRPSPARVLNAVTLMGTSGLFLYLTYAVHTLPLTWILVIPAVWAGMTLLPRPAAMFALATSLIAMGFSLNPRFTYSYGGRVPATIIMDVLVSGCTVIALLIALFRHQHNQLESALMKEQLRARARARLLDRVYESMSDGILIVSQTSQVVRQNQAAYALLGRWLPSEGPEGSWSQYLGNH